MTRTLNDNIQVDCLIDGNNWLVEEAEVSHTKASTPNYVQMIIGPDKGADYEIPDPNNIATVIGSPFELSVDNELISERDVEEDTLLFKGRISNITPLGDGFYDATAYDPSQQALSEIDTSAEDFEQPAEEAPDGTDENGDDESENDTTGFGDLFTGAGDAIANLLGADPDSERAKEAREAANNNPMTYTGDSSDEESDDSSTSEEEKTPDQKATESRQKAGSLLNQIIYIPMPETSYETINSRFEGTNYNKRTIKAKKIVTIVLEELGITDYEINLSEIGTKISDDPPRFGAFNRELTFLSPYVKAADILQKARNETLSEWWFDKSGTFHFGIPDSVKHELELIIEADDGKTTPPYQSIRVLGSGIASEEGYTKTAMYSEDNTVYIANIESSSGEDVVINDEISSDELKEPTYTYRSAEITTDAMAKDVAESFLKDIAEQQSQGEIKVVGYPEITLFDGIKMPDTKRQPMGGYAYGVYEVKHRLNSSDGFITIINVGEPVGVTQGVVSNDVPQPARNPPSIEDTDSVDLGGAPEPSDSESASSDPSQDIPDLFNL